MENLSMACVQPRLSILASHDEFDVLVRRFLRQTKAARLVVFPELTGVMLVPPMISGFKLGFVKRADQGRKPSAGILSRGVGRVADATAGALGGGLAGSVKRLLSKNAGTLQEVYLETFGRLAREFGVVVVAGSLYVLDDETGTVRNRSYVFDGDGAILGYQDKLNLTPMESSWASPGDVLHVFDTWFGRLGIVMGRDILVPELARALTVRGVDVLIGPCATPGAAQARAVRQAMSVRAEENQVYAACSFMLGPNYLDTQNREDYFGQSAVLAPISLSAGGDGVLIQAGTNRTEGVVVAELDADGMQSLRETSRFRPRQEVHLGDAGLYLAEFYSGGTTIEDAASRQQAMTVPAPLPAEPALPEPVGAAEESLEEGQWAPDEQAEAVVPGVEGVYPEADREPVSEGSLSEPGAPGSDTVDAAGPDADNLGRSEPEVMSISGAGWADADADSADTGELLLSVPEAMSLSQPGQAEEDKD